MSRYRRCARPLKASLHVRRRILLLLACLVFLTPCPPQIELPLLVHVTHLIRRRRALLDEVAPGPWVSPHLSGIARLRALYIRRHGDLPAPIDVGLGGGFWRRLRFTEGDVVRLANVLLPATLNLGDRHGTVTRYDAMAVLLRRYSTPAHLLDLEAELGYPDYKISAICTAAANYIYDTHYAKLNAASWMTPERREAYAAAIQAKGCPFDDIMGFMDGTRRPVARPKALQEAYYNGWLHNHSMLFLAVSFPDGTFMMRGPLGGRWNDVTALSDFGLDEDGPALCGDFHKIGGDGIFPINQWFTSNAIFLNEDGAAGERYNASRIAVEWLFGDISNIFRYFRSKDRQKVGEGVPARHYVAGAVLAMARNCIHGNIISEYFGVSPPTLEEVFG